MDWRYTGPCKPQLPNWSQEGCNTDNADHSFGRYFARFRINLVTLNHSADQRFAEYRNEGAYSNAGEGKSSQSQRPLSNLSEDDRVGHKAEVEDCIDDGNVEIPEHAMCRLLSVHNDEQATGSNVPYWLSKYHDKRPFEIDSHQIHKGQFLIVIATPETVVSGFFTSLLNLPS